MASRHVDAAAARRALGEALGSRVPAVVEVSEARLRAQRWSGRPPSAGYEQDRLEAQWFGTLMIARWLVSGIVLDADESAWLSRRGRAAATEQISVVNVMRGYLVWRDVVCETLESEARVLQTPEGVLAEALAVVRGSCDGTLMEAAKAFDARLQEVSAELERQRLALKHEALHDGLTSLPNRTLLYDRLEQAIRKAERGGERVAVLLVDLDGFKTINDNLGHRWGDVVLHEAAARLLHALRGSDTLARFGGDEFVAVLAHTGDDGARATAARMRTSLARPLTLCGEVISMTASVGIALYPRDGQDVAGLLAAADHAMYRAKNLGHGQSSIRPYGASGSSHGAAGTE